MAVPQAPSPVGGLELPSELTTTVHLSICLFVSLLSSSHPLFLPTSQSLASALFPRACLCFPVTQTRLVAPSDKTHISPARRTCPSSSYPPRITPYTPINTLSYILSSGLPVKLPNSC